MALLGIFRSLFSLIFVLAIIGLIYFFFKKYVARRGISARGSKFKVEEILYLDPKHKIVSVSRGKKTYVILLGNQDQLLDTITTKDEEHFVDATE